MINSSGSQARRSVPLNVEVLEVCAPQGAERAIKGLFNLSPLGPYVADFFRGAVFTSKRKFVMWANSLLIFRIYLKKIKPFLKTLPPDTVLYSYWAEFPLFVTPLTKSFRKVVRLHGGDFYVERNNGYLPVRNELYHNADLLTPISDQIANRLVSDYGISKHKVIVNRLGVENDTGELNPQPFGAEFNIVSCSNVVALKRVHLIVEALKLTSPEYKIQWHHFGDGPELENLKELVTQLPPHVTAIFHGWTFSPDLFAFYAKNPIRWLVNVSRYEGVPVSIMEAFSFGIPVLATDVGGTSEIVNVDNGFLLPLDFAPEQLARYICMPLNDLYQAKRKGALLTWQERYNAPDNYNKFIEILQHSAGF